MFEHLGRAIHNALDPDQSAVQGRQPTLETLLPGDVVSLWDGGDGVVETVLDCREELNNRVVTWRWNILDGGRVLEVGPEGPFLFSRTAVLHQDSAPFEVLTADPEQGGVLKSFEARVQAGNAARNPSLFEYDGKTYRVVSTGTFDARPVGAISPAPAPSPGTAYPRAEVWRDITPANPGENVYFELDPTDDTNPDETTVLGVWTTHIALLFGKALTGADVQAIYPRSTEQTKRS